MECSIALISATCRLLRRPTARADAGAVAPARSGQHPGGAGVVLAGRQIAAVNGQIDALVYELYGLTEEEITLVDGEHQSR